MEYYPGFDPIIVLKVRNICCRAYQKKLKKELSRLDGVFSVEINPENGLASVRGKVDPESLLKTVAKTGKFAELVGSNKNNNEHHARDEPHWHPQKAPDNHCKDGTPRNGNCCCRGTKCHTVGEGKRERDREEEHKCEDYVPPLADERMCRGYCCRNHRMRSMFHDRVPRSGYPRFFDHFPPPDGYWRNRMASEYYGPPPRWFGEEPRSSAYRRHSFGFDKYGYMGYGDPRRCTMM